MTAATGPVGLISNPASGHNRDQFERIHNRIARCPEIHHLVTHRDAEKAATLATASSRPQVIILDFIGSSPRAE